MRSNQGTIDHATVFYINNPNETIADTWSYFPKADLTTSAINKLSSFSNADLVHEAQEILEKLRKKLDKKIVFDYGLPPIDVFESDDGSILLEWIFDKFRIGINIDSDPKESGWFLVSDKSAGGVNALGYLENTDTDWLLGWLVCFVENSIELAK